MSREIKFRAWDKDENRMIHSGTEQNDYPFSWHIYNTGIGIVEYDGTDWNPLKNIKLMQYTGLKDKNGTEIYEGDIVKDCDTGRVKEVLYHLQGFVLKDNRGFFQWTYHANEHEVIGNIYENAELLK